MTTPRRRSTGPWFDPTVRRPDPAPGRACALCRRLDGHDPTCLEVMADALATSPLVGANPDDARLKHPTGTCHGCGKRVTGERRLCGICVVRRAR